MKKKWNAVLLYLKATANPFMIAVAMFIMGNNFFMLATRQSYILTDNNVYMNTIRVVCIGQIGVFLFMSIGINKTQLGKFYQAVSCAKDLYLFAPITIAFSISILYNVIIAILVGVNLNNSAVSDVIIFNSISGAMVATASACLKRKNVLPCIAPYLGYFIFTGEIGENQFVSSGFGLPVGVSILIACGIYTFGIIYAYIMLRIWWKKGDRFTQPNKYTMNVFGGQ